MNFVIYYAVHIIILAEKLKSNEMMNKISSNGIITTNYENVFFKCDGVNIGIAESK